MFSLKEGWNNPKEVTPVEGRGYTLIVLRANATWALLRDTRWEFNRAKGAFMLAGPGGNLMDLVRLDKVYAYRDSPQTIWAEAPDIEFAQVVDWEETVAGVFCPVCKDEVLQLADKCVQCESENCWSGPDKDTPETRVLAAEFILGKTFDRIHLAKSQAPDPPTDAVATVAKQKCACGSRLGLKYLSAVGDGAYHVVCTKLGGCWQGPVRDTEDGALIAAEELLGRKFEWALKPKQTFAYGARSIKAPIYTTGYTTSAALEDAASTPPKKNEGGPDLRSIMGGDSVCRVCGGKIVLSWVEDEHSSRDRWYQLHCASAHCWRGPENTAIDRMFHETADLLGREHWGLTPLNFEENEDD